MILPTRYLITPAVKHALEFLQLLEQSLRQGISLLQLRAKGMSGDAYAALAQQVVLLAHEYDAKVLLNGDPALVLETGADGLHLDSKVLSACNSRPIGNEWLLAASGHTLQAMQHAEAIRASFGVLSPVQYTSAHPDIPPLGWTGMAEITGKLELPVYALGGVSADDEETALASGAAGIAGGKGMWGST